MCQLWALWATLLQNDSFLHLYLQFFYFFLLSTFFLVFYFSTKFILQMYIIAKAYLRCCGAAKTNGSHTGILLAVLIW